MRDWYTIKAKSETETDVMIYGVIGWDVTAAQFVKDLNAIKATTINLRLNSPGGDVFDGIAIHTALKEHSAYIITHIDALAASMASVIALAGDEILMAKSAYMMIHNPWTIAVGDAEEMRKSADLLDKLNETLAQIYAEKTGESTKSVAAMMGEETWFTADEAKEIGLADTVKDEEQQETRKPMKAAAFVRNFDRVPEALRARLDLKPINAFNEGHPLPARAGEAPAATTEIPPMNAQAFSTYAAENPEAAEVKNLIAKGHKAGHADGVAQAKSDLAALVATAPGRIEDAVKAFEKGQDPDAFKEIVAAKDGEKAKADAAIADKDAKIAALVAEVEQAKALAGTQGAVGTGTTKPDATATASIADPKARAEAEWDTDPKTHEGFSSKANYVAWRESDLRGSSRIYTREPVKS